ncbi:MAG: hypothetical protein AB7P02_07515 [Alphaproteobacteria bacterium]
MAIGIGAVSVAGGAAMLVRARTAVGRLAGIGLIVMAVSCGLLSWAGVPGHGFAGGRKALAPGEPSVLTGAAAPLPVSLR